MSCPTNNHGSDHGMSVTLCHTHPVTRGCWWLLRWTFDRNQITFTADRRLGSLIDSNGFSVFLGLYWTRQTHQSGTVSNENNLRVFPIRLLSRETFRPRGVAAHFYEWNLLGYKRLMYDFYMKKETLVSIYFLRTNFVGIPVLSVSFTRSKPFLYTFCPSRIA